MNALEKPPIGFGNSLLGYLGALRDGVCSRCGGRPVGDPRGNPCGAVLPLEQLVEALELAQARREGHPIPEHAPHAGYCPCRMERLAAFAAEAAEDLERQPR